MGTKYADLDTLSARAMLGASMLCTLDTWRSEQDSWDAAQAAQEPMDPAEWISLDTFVHATTVVASR
jgi:hypothetical protein